MAYDTEKGWYQKYHNGHPVVSSPILKKYQNNRRTVMVNQLFGENLVPFYKKGHSAWDLKTKGVFLFAYHNAKGFISSKRISAKQENGKIPIQATHQGIVIYAGEDAGGGRSVKLLSDEVTIQGEKAKLETLYYHLDSWRVEKTNKLREGVIVGHAGNTGRYTTGAHQHFGVRPHWKIGNIYEPDLDNGYNGFVDPLPYMADGTIYQKGIIMPRYFQYGKEVKKADLIYIT